MKKAQKIKKKSIKTLAKFRKSDIIIKDFNSDY